MRLYKYIFLPLPAIFFRSLFFHKLFICQFFFQNNWSIFFRTYLWQPHSGECLIDLFDHCFLDENIVLFDGVSFLWNNPCIVFKTYIRVVKSHVTTTLESIYSCTYHTKRSAKLHTLQYDCLRT